MEMEAACYPRGAQTTQAQRYLTPFSSQVLTCHQTMTNTSLTISITRRSASALRLNCARASLNIFPEGGYTPGDDLIVLGSGTLGTDVRDYFRDALIDECIDTGENMLDDITSTDLGPKDIAALDHNCDDAVGLFPALRQINYNCTETRLEPEDVSSDWPLSSFISSNRTATDSSSDRDQFAEFARPIAHTDDVDAAYAIKINKIAHFLDDLKLLEQHELALVKKNNGYFVLSDPKGVLKFLFGLLPGDQFVRAGDFELNSVSQGYRALIWTA